MWLVILALVFVLVFEVLWVFSLLKRTNDTELGAICTNGPSMSFKAKDVSKLIYSKITSTYTNPVGDIPKQDVTLTAQLNCE